jgi:CheY-like chemotaxis protein
MGGEETIKAIRKTAANLPVFVASGYADDPIMQDPVKYGFTSRICKPFVIDELAEMLAKYLTNAQ